MKEKIIVPFFLMALLLTSCATSRFGPESSAESFPKYWGIIPLSFDQAVTKPSDYSTEKGKQLMVKYERNLQNIFTNVRQKYTPSEIEFVPYIPKGVAGLSFMRRTDVKTDDRFLTLGVVATFTYFNKGKSTYKERAAAIFTKYIRDLIGIALQEKQIIDDSDVTGVWIFISWSTMDDKSVKRGEGFTLIAAKEDCKRLVSHTLTPQDFIDRATIKGIQEGKDLGMISITVGPAMKAVNTMDKKGIALSLYETGTELIVEGKPRIAISFFDRAIELDQNYAEAYYFRGSAYASLSMRDVAIKDVEKARELAQVDAIKHFSSAGLAALKNNPEESCRFLKKAINDRFEDSTDITSTTIPYIIKNDAIFDGVRNAACFREIVSSK